MAPANAPKKLIEVALPLAAINKAAAREKSIRHGHPSTLHLWWARRPLAAARAVLFAQLVDDPSAHPALFPTPGGPGAGAAAAVPYHRAAGAVGEHHQRDGAGGGAGGNPRELAAHLCGPRQPPQSGGAIRPGPAARLPRSLRRRRRYPAGGAAPGPRGLRQRPQPGGGAHQQGHDRDSAPVCRPAAGQPRQPGRSGRGRGRVEGRDGLGGGRALLRAVAARRSPAAHRPPLPQGGGHGGDGAGSGPTCGPTPAANLPSSPGCGHAP